MVGCLSYSEFLKNGRRKVYTVKQSTAISWGDQIRPRRKRRRPRKRRKKRQRPKRRSDL